MKFSHILAGAVALAFTGAMASGDAAAAGAVEKFYKGRNVTLLIGYPPGGGYNRYGRTVGRHMGRHIPGNPRIVAKNMPGAGSLKSANYIYNVAPKDGTLFGIFAGGIALDSLIGGKKTKFDGRKFTWLGSANQSTSMCFAWHTSGFKTLKDVMKKQMIVGASSGGSSTFAWPTAMNSVLGTKFKVIAGYPGSKAIVLAIERGEVQGLCGYFLSSIRSVRPDWLKKGLVKILVQEALTRHPDYPNIPTALEYAKTESDKKILRLVFGWQIMGRPFAAPPGIPADRAAALRAAFDATMKDPKFLAEAKRVRIQIKPVGWKGVQKFLDDSWKTDPKLVKKVYVALGREYSSKIKARKKKKKKKKKSM